MTKAFWDTDLFKILATAVVTVAFIEPVKVWLNNRLKKRQIRRSVLAEVGLSLSLLKVMIDEVKKLSGPNQVDRMNRFQLLSHEIQRTAYDNALKDYYLFSQTPECKWIGRLYWAVSKVQSESAKYDSFDPLSLTKRTTPQELLRLCENHLDVAIDEINARPATRRIMGKYGPLFIQTLIHPKSLGMKMRECWRSTGEKINEMRTKSSGRP
jgi:hypothetical protein